MTSPVGHAGLLQAVEQAADGVVLTNCDGVIQFVNPAFTAMTGYCSEEAVDQNRRILKSGRHSAAFHADLWNTVRSGRVCAGEVTSHPLIQVFGASAAQYKPESIAAYERTAM